MRTIIVSRTTTTASRIDDPASCGGRAIAVATAARSASQFLVAIVLMPPLLIHDVNWTIVFDRKNHGFVDVHIPAIRDAQPDHIVGFVNQPPAQRHADAPG